MATAIPATIFETPFSVPSAMFSGNDWSSLSHWPPDAARSFSRSDCLEGRDLAGWRCQTERRNRPDFNPMRIGVASEGGCQPGQALSTF